MNVITFPKRKVRRAKELAWWKIALLAPSLICISMPMYVAMHLLLGTENSVTIYHNGLIGWAFLGASLMALMWFVQDVLIEKEES